MNAVECTGVGIRFFRGGRRARVIAAVKNALGRGGAADGPCIWALRDVSFSLPEGACLGICGVNGSGKTTLMRLLCGVYEVDEGSLSVSGDVVSLLSLGAGMSPILSGRDNVYLAAAVRSLSRREVDALYEEIRDFAELDDDTMATPMRYYSAGMRARLSFAISAVLTPDILLVDEILSVGDAAFRRKSGARLREIVASARCVVLTSHDRRILRDQCDHFLWLDGGRMRAFGDASVLEEYGRHQAVANR